MSVSRRTVCFGLVCTSVSTGIPRPAFAVYCQSYVEAVVLEFGDDELRRAASPFAKWMFNANSPGFVVPTTSGAQARGHSLKNGSTRKFLRYERQRNGINLGWTDNASAATEQANRNWLIARSTRGSEPIRFGELIAVGWNRSDPWLRYARRDHGINLVWSRSPSFEWKLLGGELGELGEPVVTGRDWTVLYNTTHTEPIMYLPRSGGVAHVGWPDSTKMDDPNCALAGARAAIRILAYPTP